MLPMPHDHPHDHDHPHGHEHGAGAHAGHAHDVVPTTARLTRVLWLALAINAGMALLEVSAGVHTGSVSLLADAIDFFSDAATYAITLVVLPMGALWRTRAALFKGLSMLLLGLFVAGRALWGLAQGTPPEAMTMGLIGALALAANLVVAAMLYAFREGDANLRSVWLCSRNDALGNVAVMLAALGVFGTGTAWPDLLVAAVMASLSISAGLQVLRAARAEAALQKE